MVDYASTGSAMAAFQGMEDFALRQRQGEVELRRKQLQEAEDRALQSSRIQAGQADASLSTTRAGLAAATMPYEVEQARGRAAVVGDQITQSGQQTQRGAIQIKDAETSLDEKIDQRPNRDALANEGVAQARLSTVDAKMQNQKTEAAAFRDAMDLIEKGDVMGARRLAQTYGYELPDNVINDREQARKLKEISAQAERNYPDNPKAQLDFMTLAQEAMAKNDPSVTQTPAGGAYKIEGAAVPPTSKTQSGNRLQFDAIQTAALQVGYSPRDAFDIASGQRPPSDLELRKIASEIMAKEMPSSGFNTASVEERRKRGEEILNDLKSAQPRPQTPAAGSPVPGSSAGGDSTMAPGGAAPAAAPAAGQLPPPKQGRGSGEDPYVAASQADIEWFKNSAPPGSIIRIDGEDYEK